MVGGTSMSSLKNIEKSTVLTLKEQVAYQPGQVVSKTLAQNEALSVTLFAFDKSEEISTHESGGDAFVTCLDGTGRITIDGVDYELHEGESIVMPARHPHAVFGQEHDKHWKNYAFNVALNGRFLSKVNTEEYTSNTSYEETEKVTYPAYTMWKLTLSQKVWKGVDMTLAVDNLFNYVPFRYYNNSPATKGTTFSAGLSLDIEQLFK